MTLFHRKAAPIVIYSIVWLIAISAFWLTDLSGDAMAYSLLVIYLLLPATTVIMSYLIGRDDRIVGDVTGLDFLVDKSAFVIHWRGGLGDNLVFLKLGGQIDRILLEVDHAVDHFAVRRLDETKVVDLCEHAERRNQTDVRTFRGLNRTQTAVVRVVNVTDFETGTVTRQTARTQSGGSWH